MSAVNEGFFAIMLVNASMMVGVKASTAVMMAVASDSAIGRVRACVVYQTRSRYIL